MGLSRYLGIYTLEKDLWGIYRQDRITSKVLTKRFSEWVLTTKKFLRITTWKGTLELYLLEKYGFKTFLLLLFGIYLPSKFRERFNLDAGLVLATWWVSLWGVWRGNDNSLEILLSISCQSNWFGKLELPVGNPLISYFECENLFFRCQEFRAQQWPGSIWRATSTVGTQ